MPAPQSCKPLHALLCHCSRLTDRLPRLTRSDVIDAPNKLPLKVAAATDEAKVGAGLRGHSKPRGVSLAEYRLLHLQGAVQIRSLVASLPAGLPTVRCCSAVAMVRELGGHPGWGGRFAAQLPAAHLGSLAACPPPPAVPRQWLRLHVRAGGGCQRCHSRCDHPGPAGR